MQSRSAIIGHMSVTSAAKVAINNIIQQRSGPGGAWMAAAMVFMLIAGCADIRPYVPPSEGHITAPAVNAGAIRKNEPEKAEEIAPQFPAASSPRT